MKSLVFCLAFVFSLVCLSLESQAQIFGRNRSNVQVNVARNSAVQVNAVNRSFSRNRSSNVQVNVGGGVVAPAVRVNSFGRVNAFGVVHDPFGNAFRVNSFGQPVIFSNSFRGFAVSPFGAVCH